jgi:hypothetical protein
MTAARDVLKEFGAALAREIGTESLSKFAKETAGISKHDVRAFIAGEKVPDKLTIKKIVHCFPVLMQFEHELRYATVVAKPPEKPKRHSSERKSETRLQVPKRQTRIAAETYKPRLEIVTQHAQPPEPLKHTPFVQALKKSRAEMLTELAGMVKRRETPDDSWDLSLKLDTGTSQLIVKLRLEEKGDMVDSGCYVTVSPRGTSELVVFCKAMTSGAVDARVSGVLGLLEVAKTLEAAVAGRRFE